MVKDETVFIATDSEISLLEVSATKVDGAWKYTKPGPWFKGRVPGELYEEVLKKVRELKEEGKFSKATTLLCNAGYAIELAIHGVITPEMISATEVGVTGGGRDLTTLVAIPEHEFIIDGETVLLKIIIVDCFSFGSFVFIDEDEKDL